MFVKRHSLSVKQNLGICTSNNICVSAAAKSLQSCPTLCDLIDGSSPGSPVPVILQARTLEWVAIPFSNAWKWKVKSVSCVLLLATPWTAAHQAPLSIGSGKCSSYSGFLEFLQWHVHSFIHSSNLQCNSRYTRCWAHVAGRGDKK